MNKTFSCHSSVWLYPTSVAAWHFITIPTDISQEIDAMFAHAKRGWGSLPVKVTIGQTAWTTSIFPDKKSGSFLLPLKVMVRKQENLKAGDELDFTLEISD